MIVNTYYLGCLYRRLRSTLGKLLFVGDPHVVPGELDDCRALIELVASKAREHDATVVLLGDQHHTHSVLRLEVMDFWRWALPRLVGNRVGSNPAVIMLRGNHDCNPDPAVPGSALDAYRDISGLLVVDDFPRELDGVLFVPWCKEEDTFFSMVGSGRDTHTVVCHQTFDGSLLENGFPARDGFDLSKVPQKLVISGHIHTPQIIGKCVYVGAPRWRTRSDANVDRHIVLAENDGKELKLLEKIPTGEVCRRIWHWVDEHRNPMNDQTMDLKDIYHVDVVGPSDWIKERVGRYPGAKVRVVRTDGPAPRVKEHVDERESFESYLAAYSPRHGTSRERLAELARERVWG